MDNTGSKKECLVKKNSVWREGQDLHIKTINGEYYIFKNACVIKNENKLTADNVEVTYGDNNA